jgi:hypothetical protein
VASTTLSHLGAHNYLGAIGHLGAHNYLGGNIGSRKLDKTNDSSKNYSGKINSIYSEN